MSPYYEPHEWQARLEALRDLGELREQEQRDREADFAMLARMEMAEQVQAWMAMVPEGREGADVGVDGLTDEDFVRFADERKPRAFIVRAQRSRKSLRHQKWVQSRHQAQREFWEKVVYID